MRAATALCAAVAISAASAVPLAGQWNSVTLDAAAASMRFADSIDATSVWLSPQLRYVGRRGTLTARGTLSRLAGAWTNSGRVDGSVFPWIAGPLSLELAGTAGGSAHANGARTGQMLGAARLNAASTTRGVWVGAGVGRTWDGDWLDVLQGDVGAWTSLGGRSSFIAMVEPTAVGDSIRYLDSFLALHAEHRLWDLDASVGFRAGDQLPSLPANRSVWAQAAAAFWATRYLAVVASVGAWPVDFTQGYPGGRYVSIGLRVSALPRFVLPSLLSSPTRAVGALQWTRVNGDVHRVRIRARNARTVELMADFTRWQPVRLAPDGDGWFSALLEIPRGPHETNVRVDGGPWLIPPGTIAHTDEFGGSVGLMVVR